MDARGGTANGTDIGSSDGSDICLTSDMVSRDGSAIVSRVASAKVSRAGSAMDSPRVGSWNRASGWPEVELDIDSELGIASGL